MYFEANIAENGNFIVIKAHVCALFLRSLIGENPLAREVTLYLFVSELVTQTRGKHSLKIYDIKTGKVTKIIECTDPSTKNPIDTIQVCIRFGIYFYILVGTKC